jgi:hypothetical protein
MQSMMLCLDGITVMCQYSLFMFVEFFSKTNGGQADQKDQEGSKMLGCGGSKTFERNQQF